MTFRTRFAPSPTGPLHLGHAYSAILAHDMARDQGGEFLLRIEDIDQTRARPEWEAQIYDDLTWLGLTWQTPVMRQSDRLGVYRASLQSLWDAGLLYACTCTRRDIAEAPTAPQEGTTFLGPDEGIYPRTCRHLGHSQDAGALRLNMAKAWETLPAQLRFHESGSGRKVYFFGASEALDGAGDIVLARRDMGTSYHLSVVLDDAAQGITDVIRGQDLFAATKIHVILQELLGLPQPKYIHHKLIRDDAGKRLAKRDDARSIAKYRADGASPADVRQMVGLTSE